MSVRGAVMIIYSEYLSMWASWRETFDAYFAGGAEIKSYRDEWYCRAGFMLKMHMGDA